VIVTPRADCINNLIAIAFYTSEYNPKLRDYWLLWRINKKSAPLSSSPPSQKWHWGQSRQSSFSIYASQALEALALRFQENFAVPPPSWNEKKTPRPSLRERWMKTWRIKKENMKTNKSTLMVWIFLVTQCIYHIRGELRGWFAKGIRPIKKG